MCVARFAGTLLSLGVVASGHLRTSRTSDPVDQDVGDCFALHHDEDSLEGCLLAYLQKYMPSWDTTNLGTLQLAILNDTVDLSLEARQSYGWAADIPWPIWRNWVLPFASVNEARNSWRSLFKERLANLTASPEFRQLHRIADATGKLNSVLWTTVSPGSTIVFKSEQTPKIYDPMSTIAFGYTSCTGISLMLVDGLRTIGIPACLVGTPAWNGKVANGNHNWVEVWLGHELGWSFMEGLLAGSGSLADPCTKWFCSAAKMDGTEVFTEQWDSMSNDTIYPMAWDLINQEIPGLNRTHYYREICSTCGEV
mmetsp:Transcript_43453/g.137389  ORF Transcript_43453/g.137389 Transcript_43453/m.137389 type:complete len:310 (-) Transcript_43453:235-1164(-)